MISSVEGWIVSPRKSRRKSACFSSTSTGTPARASNSPSIMPAGPPPAMQQRTECSLSGIAIPTIGGQRKPTARKPVSSTCIFTRPAPATATLDDGSSLAFSSRAASSRGDIVAIGGAVVIGDGRLGRHRAHRRAAGDAMCAKTDDLTVIGGLVIGLGHDRCSVWLGGTPLINQTG